MAQLRAPHEPAFDLADIARPVLAANGTEGVEHHARSVRAIADNVPDGTHVEVDGAGHGVHLTHPAEFAALVRSMVERCSTS